MVRQTSYLQPTKTLESHCAEVYVALQHRGDVLAFSPYQIFIFFMITEILFMFGQAVPPQSLLT